MPPAYPARGRRRTSVGQSWLLVAHAALHDERNGAQGTDLPGRITRHGDQIRQQSRLDRANTIIEMEDARVPRSCGDQRLGRCHSVRYHELELAPVLTVRVDAD